MIPVRIPADVKVTLASERRFAARRGHPIDAEPCPVCDVPVGEKVAVLVVVGIAPEDRKPGGFTTGGAVAVHAACAGVPEEEPEREAELPACCRQHVLVNEVDPRPRLGRHVSVPDHGELVVLQRLAGVRPVR